jgi:hypothetical protein
MIMRLPPELILLILDCCKDDVATLITCSLVSRCWAAATRDHLFSYVHIKDGICDMANFMALMLNPSNSIQTAVRSIRIPILAKAEPIVTLLMPNGMSLLGLEIPFVGSVMEPPRRRLLDTMATRFPNLTRLVLGNVYSQSNQSVIDFICQFRNLEVLSFSYSESDSVVTLPKLRFSPRLIALSVKTVYPAQLLKLLEQLINPENGVLSILALQIYFPSSDIQHVTQFIQSHSRTLKHLALHFSEDGEVLALCLISHLTYFDPYHSGDRPEQCQGALFSSFDSTI